MSGGGSSSQVVGYWYAVGMHMVLCHGPVDDVTAIMAGDKVGWSGDITGTTRLRINQPNLFGGEDKEGGIDGYVDVIFGTATEPCNDYLAARIGGGPDIGDPNAPPLANGLYVADDGSVHLPDGTALAGYSLPPGSGETVAPSGFIPAFRGVLSIVLRQVWVAAMNPYIKPWSARVRRYSATLGANYRTIATDANPAAIIAECLTNTDWGLGYNGSVLDIDAFNAAALTLQNENFGMSLTWSKQQKMDDFISHVLSTVDGYRYSDPTTGKIGIRLARADYDASTLLVLDDTNIEQLQELSRPDPSDIINQVTVNFIERPSWGELNTSVTPPVPTGQTILKNVDRSITVHNGASIEQVGRVNPTTIDYPGIPNINIASRVAMRELAARSRGLATVKLVANRTAAQLKGGDVFKLNWSPLGISDMVLRVTEIDYGLLTDGRITVSAVEDAFNLPTTTYMGSSGSSWQEPVENVQQIANAALIEAPYYVVAQEASDNDTIINGFPAGYGFLAVAAARQQNQATDFAVWQNGSGQYARDTSGGFTPYGTLDASIDDIAESFDVTWGDLTNFVPNSYAMLGSEFVWITGIANKTVTVTRAVFDTVPVAHAAGETLWLVGGTMLTDSQTTFLAGQQIKVKLQPKTPNQVMPLSQVSERLIQFNERAERPYVPGNIEVNGVYRPKKVLGPGLTVTWAERNRLTQTAGPVAQTDGTITPEAGTTYTVSIFQRIDSTTGWSLVEAASGVTGTSYTAQSTSLGDTQIHIEVKAVRDGLDSYQTQVLEFDFAGYGVGYGNYYGGI